MRTVCFAAFAALALTACGGGDETAPTPGVGTAAAAPTPAGETAASVLVLTAGGLAVTGTMPRPIAFGTPKAEFVEAVNAVLGPAPLPESENAECPAGPVTVIDWNGLSATVQDDRFAGWLIQDGSLKTSSGLGVASSRARIEAGPGYRLETDSTLGPEFSVDGVGGLYNGEGADAGVDLMFAGVTCFAR